MAGLSGKQVTPALPIGYEIANALRLNSAGFEAVGYFGVMQQT